VSGLRRLLVLLGLAAILLPACLDGGQPAMPANVLTVLAGSELKDLAPMFPDIEKNTGWHLQPTYIGSLDGAQAIASGDKSDLAWFSSGKYLTLLQGTSGRIVTQQKIMLSPVVLGVKHSTALRLGWVGNSKITWADIAAQSKSGALHYAMTNPTSSNSGFVALLGVATAFAGNGNTLDSGNINTAALKDFFAGQTLTAGSSGFLADSYVRVQDQSNIDGLINYESVLLSLNSGGKLHEPLDLIYPKDGILTADYPLMLLNNSKRAAYDKLVAYLTSPDVQQRIMTTTSRRPAIPEVKPDSRFPNQLLVELTFPSNLNVINQLLLTYLDEIRKPDTVVFVLDISGSMSGDRISAVKAAFANLTGGDTSLTGQFARFRKRESIVIIPFNGAVVDNRTFAINDNSPGSADVKAVRNYVNSLQPDDGTAIYDALFAAYQTVGSDMAIDPNRFYSVVLMTDGENNTGRDANGFLSYYRGLPAELRNVHTFPIIFGEASPAALNQVASATGGQTFDARSVSMSLVFKQIRGYQ
jgi:Ca-activated chloride channel family protein